MTWKQPCKIHETYCLGEGSALSSQGCLTQLRSHVRDSTDGRTGCRCGGSFGKVPRDAKVCEADPAILHPEQVFWLDIAVDKTVLVQVI